VSWLLVVWVCESWGAVFGLARPRYWAAPSENSRRGARGQSHPLHNGVETEEKWCVSPASARWKQFASPRGAPFVRQAMDEIKPNGHLGGEGTRFNNAGGPSAGSNPFVPCKLQASECQIDTRQKKKSQKFKRCSWFDNNKKSIGQVFFIRKLYFD
jgi:hypothetical protein